MTACGVPLARRGVRADEYLRAMRVLWSADAASFDGEFVRFDSVTANPKPHQDRIHVVVGGHSDAALRRAIETANGWYGFMRDLETTCDDLARIERLAADCDRPAELGPLEISITPRVRPDELDPEAFAEAGVHRLVLSPGGHLSEDELLTFVEANRPT